MEVESPGQASVQQGEVTLAVVAWQMQQMTTALHEITTAVTKLALTVEQMRSGVTSAKAIASAALTIAIAALAATGTLAALVVTVLTHGK